MKLKLPCIFIFFLIQFFFINLNISLSFAKTRWSALHFIPDADLLYGGQFIIAGEGYYFKNTSAQSIINPGFYLTTGIIEWVNIEAGYCGGPLIGIKARILGETKPWLPSIAIGAHNIFSSREAGLFSYKDKDVANEFYVAFAKSIEPIKMRLHIGLETIPQTKSENLNPFFGIEEYFGAGFYASLEVFRRKQEFHPSLFLTYRFLKKTLEVSLGAVRINRLFFDENNQFKFSLGDTGVSDFVKPGIWFGLRYSFNLGFGKSQAFKTFDDIVKSQDEKIMKLNKEIDSLKLQIKENINLSKELNNRVLKMTDSLYADQNKLKTEMIEKITILKNMYQEEPFDPDRVKRAISEIVVRRDNILPSLREIIIDKKLDKRIRTLAIFLIGEIKSPSSSDILLDILNQSQDPEIKIEIIIALGKIKETRAQYVFEQLANDPVDEVAYTAQKVLIKLATETGIKLSPQLNFRKIDISDSVIKERKIEKKEAVKSEKEVTLKRNDITDTSKAQNISKPDSLQKEKKEQKNIKADTIDTIKLKKESKQEDVWQISDTSKQKGKDILDSSGVVNKDNLIPDTLSKKDTLVEEKTKNTKKKEEKTKEKKNKPNKSKEDKNESKEW
jgi:hypothetical protein